MEVLLSLFFLIFLPIIYKFAEIRSNKQPIFYSSQAESLILSHLYKYPLFHQYIKDLTPQHFAFPKHRILYSRLISLVDREKIISEFPILNNYLNIYENWVEKEIRSDKNYNYINKIRYKINKHFKYDKIFRTDFSNIDYKIYEQAEFCFTMGEDRLVYNGLSTISETNDPLLPLKRITKPLSKKLQSIFAIMYLLSIHSSFIVADKYSTNSFNYYLLIFAFFLLSTGSLILSIIDVNTMYIDFFPTFIFTLLFVYISLYLFTINIGNTELFWRGILYTIFASIFFYTVNKLYFIIRNKNGIGGGDMYLLLLTSTPIVILSGYYITLFYTILFGFLLSILIFILRYPFKKYRITSATPFPLGPYLSIGWILLVLLDNYTSIILNLNSYFLI
jgi:prepilin signal peptidase PulO-like enzyme (type II secretory pathway)